MNSALSYEQKNKNILSRFESNRVGTKARSFKFELVCGKRGTLVMVNGEDLASARAVCLAQFGAERLANVE